MVRQRASSVAELLDVLPQARLDIPTTETVMVSATPSPAESRPAIPLLAAVKRVKAVVEPINRNTTFLSDLFNARWMTNPVSSLKLISLILGAYFTYGLAYPQQSNPLAHLVFISYPLELYPGENPAVQLYDKGLQWDAAFLGFYIIVFSFLRQAITEFGVGPLARRLGLRGEKVKRFEEQGYALCYFTCSGLLGLVSLL